MQLIIRDLIYRSPLNRFGGGLWADRRLFQTNIVIMVGSINSIFYFLHKAAEPFNCLEQDNLA